MEVGVTPTHLLGIVFPCPPPHGGFGGGYLKHWQQRLLGSRRPIFKVSECLLNPLSTRVLSCITEL